MSQEPVKIIVYVSGGVVQDIHTLGVHCDVAVIDADVDGCPDEELTEVLECTGETYRASVGIWELREAGDNAAENFNRVEMATYREQDGKEKS